MSLVSRRRLNHGTRGPLGRITPTR